MDSYTFLLRRAEWDLTNAAWVKNMRRIKEAARYIGYRALGDDIARRSKRDYTQHPAHGTSPHYIWHWRGLEGSAAIVAQVHLRSRAYSVGAILHRRPLPCAAVVHQEEALVSHSLYPMIQTALRELRRHTEALPSLWQQLMPENYLLYGRPRGGVVNLP
jgi:hypothetical protein